MVAVAGVVWGIGMGCSAGRVLREATQATVVAAAEYLVAELCFFRTAPSSRMALDEVEMAAGVSTGRTDVEWCDAVGPLVSRFRRFNFATFGFHDLMTLSFQSHTSPMRQGGAAGQ